MELVLVNGRRFCNVIECGKPIELGETVTVSNEVGAKLLEGMTLDKRGNDVPRFLETSNLVEVHKYLPGWPETEEIDSAPAVRNRNPRRRSTAGKSK